MSHKLRQGFDIEERFRLYTVIDCMNNSSWPLDPLACICGRPSICPPVRIGCIQPGQVKMSICVGSVYRYNLPTTRPAHIKTSDHNPQWNKPCNALSLITKSFVIQFQSALLQESSVSVWNGGEFHPEPKPKPKPKNDSVLAALRDHSIESVNPAYKPFPSARLWKRSFSPP